MRKALSRKKVMFSCFFDISKAFDSVWHTKLLHHLKSAGISSSLYLFVRSFLADRYIVVRWKGVLSPRKKIDMGVPQGSVIAPLLFSIMIANVGKNLKNDTVITSYADDIAIWRTTKIKRPQKTASLQKHAINTFQAEIDYVVHSLEGNGFMLSSSKTVFMPIICKGRKIPPHLTISVKGVSIKPSSSVRYLGFIFQRNGLMTAQVKQAITNGRRALNLIRAVRHEPWGQKRDTLVHLTLALVRSRLRFGSPAMYNLPPTYIKNLATVECIALRIALGLPKGVPHRQTYNEAGVLPIWHCIQRNACKYLYKAGRVPNSTEEELNEEWNQSPISNNFHSLVTATQKLRDEAGIQVRDRHNASKPSDEKDPPWKHEPPETHKVLPGLTKEDSPHILVSHVMELITKRYEDNFHIYTDGSVAEDGSTGAGVYLKSLNKQLSFKISPCSILSAELCAIEKALQELNSLPLPHSKAVIFTDSKSSLDVISSEFCDSRPDILKTILKLTSTLKAKGTYVKYQWVPSHCGLIVNETADRAAKAGANKIGPPEILFQLSLYDLQRKINHAAWSLWDKDFTETALTRKWSITTCQGSSKDTLFSHIEPNIACQITRIRTNSWKTKFTATRCPCQEQTISFQHCLFDCPYLHNHFEPLRNLFKNDSNQLSRLQNVTKDSPNGWDPIILAAKLTISSEVGPYL